VKLSEESAMEKEEEVESKKGFYAPLRFKMDAKNAQNVLKHVEPKE